MPRLPIEVVANVKKAEKLPFSRSKYTPPCDSFPFGCLHRFDDRCMDGSISCHFLEKADEAVLPKKRFASTLRAGGR